MGRVLLDEHMLADGSRPHDQTLEDLARGGSVRHLLLAAPAGSSRPSNPEAAQIHPLTHSFQFPLTARDPMLCDMTTTTIKGGTLISASGQSRGDVLIDEGRIVAVGDVESRGDLVDATGQLVMPGMVDTHVHLMDPGETDREDFPSGTRAAAARGVTTIVEHTHSHPVRSPKDLREKRDHIQGRSNVDFGLAAHVWPDRIDQIVGLSAEGISFFKIFTCDTHGVPGLDQEALHAALSAIAGADGRCLIHNEDEELTSEAERRWRGANRTDPASLGEWRSREAELIAVRRSSAAVLDTGAVATFAHVSTPDVLDVIDGYRDLGADIAAEACPQYFALNEDEVEEHGALRKFTPRHESEVSQSVRQCGRP